jgi:hypothetical protein
MIRMSETLSDRLRRAAAVLRQQADDASTWSRTPDGRLFVTFSVAGIMCAELAEESEVTAHNLDLLAGRENA